MTWDAMFTVVNNGTMGVDEFVVAAMRKEELAYERGREEGYSKGYTEGYEDGHYEGMVRGGEE